MSRYLMVLWSGGGAVPPQLATAKRLVRRGHDVCVLAPRSLADVVGASGARFEPYRAAPEHDVTRPELDLLRDWEVSGLKARARMRDNVMFGTAAGIAEDVLAVVSKGRPDVLLTDYILLGSYLAAEAAGLPVAGLMHTIVILPRKGVPPFGTGWKPAANPVAAARHALRRRIAARFFDARLGDINQLRGRLGLAPLTRTFELLARADRLLAMSSPAFDYPGPLPPNTRWVGPVIDPDLPPAGIAQQQGAQPFVLVSLSTTVQGQTPLLGRIIGALSDLPVRALVTCGPAVDPGQFRGGPNVEVMGSKPHHQVLPHTDLVITHGGHGTVTAAMRHGVPVLCLPMGRDQADVAARAQWRGAGMVGSAHSSPQRLRKLIGQALSQETLRDGARRIAADFAAEDPDAVVVELEKLARRPPAFHSPGTQPSRHSNPLNREAASPVPKPGH